MSIQGWRKDQIIFENVADQYIRGEDVSVNFTIENDFKVDPDQDKIGLIRVGSIDMKECFAFAPIQLDAAARHGTATFSSTSLEVSEDEFYQFCYLNSKGKNVGTSIPFQLNCSSTDIDLLSSSLFTSIGENRDKFISTADRENDDLIVVQTKQMLVEEKLRQENRHLFDLNRRLEEENDQTKLKLELVEAKSNQNIHQVKSQLEALAAYHKTTVEDLTVRQQVIAKLRGELDTTMNLCEKYQNESLRFAERCQTLEENEKQMKNEVQQLNSQLKSSDSLMNEQNVQITDLKKSLLQSNESLALANQNQVQLEQKYRDLRLTNEKRELSMQGQLDAFSKQSIQQENQIHALQSANVLLREELNSANTDKTHLLTMVQEVDRMNKNLKEQHRTEVEKMAKEISQLQNQLVQGRENSQEINNLNNSIKELTKRCVKHQKSEIEAKKQLAIQTEFVNELQNKVQELTERLAAGSEAYKTLYRKFAELERPSTNQSNPTTLSNETGLNEDALVSLLRDSYELQQKDNFNRVEEEREITECPMCYWEFPSKLTLEEKKNHIENHFN